MKEKTNRIYHFNGFRLEVDEGLLKKGDEVVPLTPKAFDTLVVLIENRGKLVEKEFLLNKVWANTFVGEETLAQNISTLRKALGLSENGKPLIETTYRRGYKFVADVSETRGAKESPTVIKDKESAPPQFGQRSNVLKFPARTYARLLPAAFLLIVVISLLIGLKGYFQTQDSTRASRSSVNSIAVLPFRVIGEPGSEEKLGFGMTDAIITRLGRLQKIPVRPTSAVFRYVDAPASSAREAGIDLGVDAILEGIIQRDGELVRVTLHLTSVRDGKSLWAETIDEKDANIFALQDAIADKIVQSLAFKLTPEQRKLLAERPTNNREAFEAYQLGVYLWNTRTQENLQKARKYFEKAIELDPEFAGAYAMLADTLNLIGYYGHANREELYKEAYDNAAQALALDDSLAEPFIALAAVHLYRKNFAAARK
jgi:DNA-binding winged helix-turn-helix (wHTH) protein/TolB-like protein